MIDQKIGINCTGCSACLNSCPKHCIEMIENKEGFLYPQVNTEKCIKCGVCINKCPVLNERKTNKKEEIIVAFSNDEENRKNSSSGGCFSEFAKIILQESGIVFGATFDTNLCLKHIDVSKEKDLKKLQGSKYLQSEIGKSFVKAKDYLNNGKVVLYSGTPCQIAGLKYFLGKDYDNLYTISVICHGVPSKKVFNKYINQCYKKHQVQDIFFRDKTYGWKNFSMRIKLKNKKDKVIQSKKDYFMKLFLSNICLRESCYDCRFRDCFDVSDISIGDFWGVNNIRPEINDDKGISILIIRTLKGNQLLKKCEDKLTIQDNINKNDLIKFNPCIVNSVKKPTNRNEFFSKLDTLNIKDLSKKYTPKKITFNKIKNKFYSIMKKVIK